MLEVALSDSTVLELWERGQHRHPLDRGLLLYALASADAPDALADHPLGWRNRALLSLHADWLGDGLDAFVDCPQCGERLELPLSVAALLAPAAEADPDLAPTVEVEGLRVRVPTTRDLARLVNERDEDSGATRLLSGLVDGQVECASLAALAPRIGAALEAVDPCASFRFELSCPACSHAWSAPFDPATYLWEQVAVRSRRVLDEVHLLASAYAWPEHEILALSSARRQAYLERVLG